MKLPVGEITLAGLYRVCQQNAPACLRTSFSFFWPHRMACGILVPGPGIEPMHCAVEARSLNHWTAREFPGWYCLQLTYVKVPNFDLGLWWKEKLLSLLKGHLSLFQSSSLENKSSCIETKGMSLFEFISRAYLLEIKRA